MKVIAASSVIEIVTGVVLFIVPSLVARLLLGTDLSPAGDAVGRVAGFGLLSLGTACWPRPQETVHPNAPLRGLLIYNVLATLFFVYLGLRGDMRGVLLWPAAALHGVLAVLIARIFFSAR
jgi:hypothetical protein